MVNCPRHPLLKSIQTTYNFHYPPPPPPPPPSYTKFRILNDVSLPYVSLISLCLSCRLLRDTVTQYYPFGCPPPSQFLCCSSSGRCMNVAQLLNLLLFLATLPYIFIYFKRDIYIYTTACTGLRSLLIKTQSLHQNGHVRCRRKRTDLRLMNIVK